MKRVRRPKGLKAISQSTLANARVRHPAAISSKLHSSGKLKVMVLKHTPLGEINLPFVASNAIIPRCRRNRRQTERHQACLNGRGAKEGNSKLTDAYPASAEKLQINLRFLSACTNFNLLRSLKLGCASENCK